MPELSHTIVELDSQYIKATNAALRLLAYRSRSEAEVRRRLLGRFTGEVIDRALSDLRRQGLLNDAAFAKEWREQREKFRPKGPAVIRQELQRLGLNREVIQDPYPISTPTATLTELFQDTRPSYRWRTLDNFAGNWADFCSEGALKERSWAVLSNAFGASYRTRITAM